MKSSAFTLIELMIVVAIIAFLAAIGIPQYFKYQAKARAAEVAITLASLHTAEQAYYAEHGEYSDNLNGDGGIGWKPEGYHGGGKTENFFYTYGIDSANSQEGINYFTGKLEAGKDGLTGSQATKDGFIAKATAMISGKVDTWQIDENRKIEHTQNGID